MKSVSARTEQQRLNALTTLESERDYCPLVPLLLGLKWLHGDHDGLGAETVHPARGSCCVFDHYCREMDSLRPSSNASSANSISWAQENTQRDSALDSLSGSQGVCLLAMLSMHWACQTLAQWTRPYCEGDLDLMSFGSVAADRRDRDA